MEEYVVRFLKKMQLYYCQNNHAANQTNRETCHFTFLPTIEKSIFAREIVNSFIYVSFKLCLSVIKRGPRDKIDPQVGIYLFWYYEIYVACLMLKCRNSLIGHTRNCAFMQTEVVWCESKWRCNFWLWWAPFSKHLIYFFKYRYIHTRKHLALSFIFDK